MRGSEGRTGESVRGGSTGESMRRSEGRTTSALYCYWDKPLTSKTACVCMLACLQLYPNEF